MKLSVQKFINQSVWLCFFFLSFSRAPEHSATIVFLVDANALTIIYIFAILITGEKLHINCAQTIRNRLAHTSHTRAHARTHTPIRTCSVTRFSSEPERATKFVHTGSCRCAATIGGAAHSNFLMRKLFRFGTRLTSPFAVRATNGDDGSGGSVGAVAATCARAWSTACATTATIFVFYCSLLNVHALVGLVQAFVPLHNMTNVQVQNTRGLRATCVFYYIRINSWVCVCACVCWCVAYGSTSVMRNLPT